MAVAFDLRAAAGRPTGVGRYLRSIVRALCASAPEIDVRAYVGRDDVEGLAPGVTVRSIRTRGAAWHMKAWADMQRDPVAAYVSTSLIVPSFPRVHSLPVILDVTSFQFPEVHTRRTRLFEGRLMPRLARQRPLITATGTTQGDVRRIFRTTMPITVVPPAPEPIAQEQATQDAMGSLELPHPFVLFVGTLEPRKNVLLAVRAVRVSRQNGVPITLVMAGARGWLSRHDRAEVDLAVRDGIAQELGYVTDAQREALYHQAKAVVMPSLYEGFGLPLLEAMGRGVPCVCSDTPTLVEVSQGAADHISIDDLDGWATALTRMTEDATYRTRAIDNGLRRFQAFTPAATSDAFLKALETSQDR